MASPTKYATLNALAGAVAVLDRYLPMFRRSTDEGIALLLPDIEATRTGLMDAMSRIQATDDDAEIRDIFTDAVARYSARSATGHAQAARFLGSTFHEGRRGILYRALRAFLRGFARLNGDRL